MFQLQGERGAEHSDERVLPRLPMETDGTGSAPGEGGRSLAHSGQFSDADWTPGALGQEWLWLGQVH